MRIFCIGRNYVEHIQELNNERPDEPVIFSKPDTALIRNNGPFYYPDFSKDIHHEVELVLRICKEGKNIEIRGFGSFKTKKRKARIARNPRTGAQVQVDEHFVPFFKVSKELKSTVNLNLKRKQPTVG